MNLIQFLSIFKRLDPSSLLLLCCTALGCETYQICELLVDFLSTDSIIWLTRDDNFDILFR